MQLLERLISRDLARSAACAAGDAADCIADHAIASRCQVSAAEKEAICAPLVIPATNTPWLRDDVMALHADIEDAVFEFESAIGRASHDLAGAMERKEAKEAKDRLRYLVKRLAILADGVAP